MIPDNVEKIIMTKEDYDRNVEQLLVEKIRAEQEIERLQRQKEELQVNGLRQETLFKLEIERLHSIIKEVREYIEEKYDYLLRDTTFLDHDERIDNKQINHILEILKGSDKE